VIFTFYTNTTCNFVLLRKRFRHVYDKTRSVPGCKPVNVTALHMQRCVHVRFRRCAGRVRPLRQWSQSLWLRTGFHMRQKALQWCLFGSISSLMAPMKFIPRSFEFCHPYIYIYISFDAVLYHVHARVTLKRNFLVPR